MWVGLHSKTGIKKLKDKTEVFVEAVNLGDKFKLTAKIPSENIYEFLWVKKNTCHEFSWQKLFRNLEIKRTEHKKVHAVGARHPREF